MPALDPWESQQQSDPWESAQTQTDPWEQQSDTTGTAFTHGLVKGGFSVAAGWGLAAAGDASGFNEGVSAFTGPAAPVTFGALNILEFLGGSLLADRGVKTGEKALSQYSQSMRA